MSVRLHLFVAVFLVLVGAAWASSPKPGEPFGPISSDELKMTSEPLAPGAPAIILLRVLEREDAGDFGHDFQQHEHNYKRIKILTEEGRKYADVEIPYYEGDARRVVNIKARTTHPDGKVIDFDGTVYDKELVKARGYKYMAKTFTLPDVQVGSVIEYEYTEYFSEYEILDSQWILSDELFTRRAKFQLRPHEQRGLSYSVHSLPAGTDLPTMKPRNIRLETKNIPAFMVEDHMPPQEEMKSRIDFNYTRKALIRTDEKVLYPNSVEFRTPKSVQSTDRFWLLTTLNWYSDLEFFIGRHGGIEDAARQIVSPSDSPEVKLQKIYARVQQLRNTSYEVEKTKQEVKREKLKSNDTVEDVWKRGYGDRTEITWLFLALVRAAGFEAYGVLVSDRNSYFFNTNSRQDDKLDTSVVLVKVEGKDRYFDPGAKFTPYGLLPWCETKVPGRRLDKDGGVWVTTSSPNSSASRIDHKADLRVTETGDLEGIVTMTLVGLEAAKVRQEERHQDEADRKKFLEDLLKDQIPAPSEVQLTNKPDWDTSSVTMVAEYKLKVPGWMAPTARRAVLPLGVFSGNEKTAFVHSERRYPIYFEFPYSKEDDLKISFPSGWEVGSLPPAQKEGGPETDIAYSLNTEKDGSTIHVNRKMRVDLFYLKPELYSLVRNFFSAVRTGDEHQAVLQSIATSSAGK